MTYRIFSCLVAIFLILATIVSVKAVPVYAQEQSTPLKVCSVFATNASEPWDTVIHDALVRQQDRGRIAYEMTDDVGYDGAMETALRAMAEQDGCQVIFGDAFGQEELVREVAADYPTVPFIFGSGGDAAAPNFSVFDNWLQQASYLAGTASGLMTETQSVGVVAGFPVPEVNRIVNAYINGVKETCPECTVTVLFINSWFDEHAAQEAAQSIVDSTKADVLFCERFGCHTIADEYSLLWVGMMSDQRELYPQGNITSVVWNMDGVVDTVLSQVESGTYTSINFGELITLSNGGASLAPWGDVVPYEVQSDAGQRQLAILSGLYVVEVNNEEPPAVTD